LANEWASAVVLPRLSGPLNSHRASVFIESFFCIKNILTRGTAFPFVDKQQRLFREDALILEHVDRSRAFDDLTAPRADGEERGG
jgi:hypothetical protein